ncbi:MAG: cytochrome c biogenesis CcdA family protein [Promethearchaeota archaeon]
MDRKSKIQIGILTSAIILSLGLFLFNVRGDEQLSLTFYGQWGCGFCHEKYDLINNFVENYPEINATYLWVPNNISISDYYTQLAALGETSPPPPPAVILNRSNEIIVLYYKDITTGNLEAWRLGKLLEPTEFTIWIAFLTGLITGISACMLLLLSVLGTSLTIVESRAKYFIISTGLITGLICAYIGVSLLFLFMLNALSVISYLKYIFGGILFTLGVWQIIEFKKEESVIFSTPQRVKSVLKTFIERRSGLYAFLVGLIFAFIKIPCFGAPYLQLIFFSQNAPILIFLIIFYFIGMLLPIIGILIALRIGIQSEKINKFRLDYRPYLRLLSGSLLITLTLYLFLDLYITLELILWIILGEIIIFVLFIWIKSKKAS